MKQQLFLGLVVLLLLILLPLTSLWGKPAQPQQPGDGKILVGTNTLPAGTANTARANPRLQADAQAAVPVMRSGTGKVEAVPMEEYLMGCLAAEMPAEYHIEALKAQVVASHTYVRYKLEVAGAQRLSDSGASDQAYLSKQERQNRFGVMFEGYEEKFAAAVQAVQNETVTFDDVPIFAAFHSQNGGMTESAETYWGDTLEYLQSTNSPGDKLAPNYSESVTFTPKEIKKALADEEVVLRGDETQWFGKPKRSNAGTVRTIAVGGQTIAGPKLRTLLGLRSANFTIAYKGGKFVFTCLGHGHGVGMSQYGADFMARQGSDYREILRHYYAGCDVSRDR
ncbi:MAG: stage II sporulation protein D [Oscillospiraceae bacterium]|nr:stage II sporulation protein D [Oscillospiraceae bacterium]